MSLLYQLACPQCCRPTTLGIDGCCANALKDGGTCGYSFTWLDAATRNATQQKKEIKHSSPPATIPPGDDVSWCPSVTDYRQLQKACALTGSLYFDPAWSYLFLWDTPSGASPFGTLLYAHDCTFTDVSGVKLPLNSNPNDLHVHFDNYRPHFIKIADYGPNLAIKFPSYDGGNEFKILSGGQPVFTWNPATSGYYFGS